MKTLNILSVLLLFLSLNLLQLADNDVYMSKFYSFVILAFFLTNLNSFAQVKRNAVYAEIGGNAGIYSVNYERLISLSNKTAFAPRVGFSYLGGDRFNLPLELNLLFGKNASKHFAEFGLGSTLILPEIEPTKKFSLIQKNGASKGGISTLFTVRAGYRYQKPEGGLMYRAGLLALTRPNASSPKILPFVGLSIGYSF